MTILKGPTKKEVAKKPSPRKFNMNDELGKAIEAKCLNPTYKYMDAGDMYDNLDFKNSGLTKTQFRGGVNRIRAKHGIIVEKAGKNKRTYSNI